jgi:hypothetical protein
MKRFFNENFISIFCSGAELFILGGFAWAYVVLSALGSKSLILHFDDANGITHVGGAEMIVFMGIFGTLVTLMNFAIAREFAARDRFLGKFVAAITLLFAVLLFIAFVAIINANV